MMKVDDFFFVIIWILLRKITKILYLYQRLSLCLDLTNVLNCQSTEHLDIPAAAYDSAVDATLYFAMLRYASPFPVPTVFSNEAFQLPWLRGQSDFPHDFFVDLDAQPGSLQRFDEPILHGKSFWIRYVAADVIFAGCAKEGLTSPEYSVGGLMILLPSTL